MLFPAETLATFIVDMLKPCTRYCCCIDIISHNNTSTLCLRHMERERERVEINFSIKRYAYRLFNMTKFHTRHAHFNRSCKHLRECWCEHSWERLRCACIVLEVCHIWCSIFTVVSLTRLCTQWLMQRLGHIALVHGRMNCKCGQMLEWLALNSVHPYSDVHCSWTHDKIYQAFPVYCEWDWVEPGNEARSLSPFAWNWYLFVRVHLTFQSLTVCILSVLIQLWWRVIPWMDCMKKSSQSSMSTLETSSGCPLMSSSEPMCTHFPSSFTPCNSYLHAQRENIIP